ncbi:MAG: PcfJ domain-containing protein [bacterium]
MEVLKHIYLSNIYDLYYAQCAGIGYDRKYYCPKCRHVFSVNWHPPTACSNEGWRVTCPSCGRYFSTRYLDKNSKWGFTGSAGRVLNAVLQVKDYRNRVELQIKYQILNFGKDLKTFNQFCIRPVRETINFTKGRVTWHRSDPLNNGRELFFDLGDPFDFTFFNYTFLTHLSAESNISTEERAEITKLMKILRKAVAEKLWPSYNRKKSAWVSNGSYGYLALPVFNLAFRNVFPDAPNLTEAYRNRTKREVMLNKIKNPADANKFRNLKGQANFIDSLLTNFKIPLTAVNRKIIAEDFTEIDRLSYAHRLSRGNIDTAANIYQVLKKRGLDIWDYRPVTNMLARKYGADRLAKCLYDLPYDCIYLWRNLNPENKRLLLASKIRPRDLHDWMADKHRLQNYEHINFEVPEHIIRRLQMQKDRLKFFLPGEARELYYAGKELHNCVASYSERMASGQVQIVLVSDDKGKLVACLEIRGNALVQAKLNHNKAVKQIPELNQEILAWAHKANLKINTKDIAQGEEESKAV